MKEMLKKASREMGAILMTTVVVGAGCFFMVQDAIAKMTQESYQVKGYNVDKSKLLTFEVDSENGGERIYNPYEKELEKELEVEIVRDGKKETLHFSKLNIQRDDVSSMQIRMNPEEDGKEAKSILVIPNQEVLYE